MFCDLVGSTSLAAKLDAEDWRNLVNAYLDEASKAVTGLGGHVLKRLGDGLMALFGYPQAQENDAERAAARAFAIQRALSDLNARNAAKGAPELKVRIGIELRPVVVEAAGEVFGDAPNVAARVQAAAEPGSVVITMNVQRQVAGLFVAEEQGARELKGVVRSGPALSHRPRQRRRPKRRRADPDALRRTRGGAWRAGAPLGAGEGRRRPARADRRRAGPRQVAAHRGVPLAARGDAAHLGRVERLATPAEHAPAPDAEWGRQRFGVDAPAEQRLADLESTLRLIGLDPVEHAPLLARSWTSRFRRAARPFPPEELRRRQLAAMTAWVLAGRGPSRSCSLSRTCIGPTRPRSTYCAP